MKLTRFSLLLVLACGLQNNMLAQQSFDSDTTIAEIKSIVLSEYPHASNIKVYEAHNIHLWEYEHHISYKWKYRLESNPICPKDGLIKVSICIYFEEHYLENGQEHNHYKTYYITKENDIVCLWYKWHEPGAHDAEWRLFNYNDVAWCKHIKGIAYGK